MTDRVIYICETHWRPLRQHMLTLASRGVVIECVLRGPIVPNTIPLIPPLPAIRLRHMARWGFKAMALLVAWRSCVSSRCQGIFCDRPRMYRVLKRGLLWWGSRVTLVR